MALLHTSALTKRYEGCDQPVINAVDLSVEPGDFLVIMGSSGSGKSTLLYLLSGLDSPDSGSVQLNGQTVSSLGEHERAIMRRKTMGFVFQDFNLISHLTILQNVTVPGSLVTTDAKRLEEKARKLLDFLGIGELADRLPSRVSGGEAQRCAMARALINEPLIIFADEPTGNLNSAASTKLLDELRRLNSTGQTIVMVTHELKAACMGRRVIYLKDGSIQDSLNLDQAASPDNRESVLFDWLKQQGW